MAENNKQLLKHLFKANNELKLAVLLKMDEESPK